VIVLGGEMGRQLCPVVNKSLCCECILIRCAITNGELVYRPDYVHAIVIHGH